MRIKYLSVIAGLSFLTLAVTSCLDSNDEYELSSDDTISSFNIDKIYGAEYKFTIDQLAGEYLKDGVVIKLGKIYNVDSIAYGADTIINKMPLRIISGGFLTAGNGTLSEDTLFNYQDSIDLTKTMEKPLVIRVRSYDGMHIKEYHIEARIHKSDPDTLVWGGIDQRPMTRSFSGGAVKESQEFKAVTMEDNIFVYASNTELYSSNIADGREWTYINKVNLPASASLSSILTFNNDLYTHTSSGEMYRSSDGMAWEKVQSILPGEGGSEAAEVVNLITTFGNDSNTTDLFVAGIIKKEGEQVFAIAKTGVDNSLQWTAGEKVPATFPLENISAIKSFRTNTGMQRAIMIGKPYGDDPQKTIPWFSNNGLDWGAMETAEEYSIPAMEYPTLMHYGKTLYAFGEDFSDFYTSENGIAWRKISRKFVFPKDKESGEELFFDRSRYTMTIDKNNYIWIIWGDGDSHTDTDEIWRARLNRLGFLIQ